MCQIRQAGRATYRLFSVWSNACALYFHPAARGGRGGEDHLTVVSSVIARQSLTARNKGPLWPLSLAVYSIYGLFNPPTHSSRRSHGTGRIRTARKSFRGISSILHFHFSNVPTQISRETPLFPNLFTHTRRDREREREDLRISGLCSLLSIIKTARC